jgi:hypothetical protein
MNPVEPPTSTKKQKKPKSYTLPPGCKECPMCKQPIGEEKTKKKDKPQVESATKMEMPTWPAPFLPQNLLQPVKKYEKEYHPHISGQNCSMPTQFSLVPELAKQVPQDDNLYDITEDD